MTNHRLVSSCVVALLAAGAALAQTNRVDVVTPSAPELAPYGAYAIGVRTIQVTDKNRPDILNTKEGGPTARYDRTLTLEVWYPATLAAGQKPGGDYRTITRDPAIARRCTARPCATPRRSRPAARSRSSSSRTAIPATGSSMSHLGENLASKGFVVASIDHKDSTYDDQKAFASTLYNRPFDQLFVLNEMERLGKRGLRQFSQRAGRREPHRPRRLLDGRLRRGERDRRRLQQGERDAHRRRRRTGCSPSAAPPIPSIGRIDATRAHQGGDRHRAVGHARPASGTPKG